MDRIKNDKYYLEKVHKDLGYLLKVTAGITKVN